MAHSELTAAVEAIGGTPIDDLDTDELLRGWRTLRDAISDLQIVAREWEREACERLDEPRTVDGTTWKASGSKRREWTPEGKQRLKDTIVQHVCRDVALDPLTGELDSERARVARDAVGTLERWLTLDPSKAKKAACDAAGVDVGEYAEAQRWVPTLREVP